MRLRCPPCLCCPHHLLNLSLNWQNFFSQVDCQCSSSLLNEKIMLFKVVRYLLDIVPESKESWDVDIDFCLLILPLGSPRISRLSWDVDMDFCFFSLPLVSPRMSRFSWDADIDFCFLILLESPMISRFSFDLIFLFWANFDSPRILRFSFDLIFLFCDNLLGTLVVFRLSPLLLPIFLRPFKLPEWLLLNGLFNGNGLFKGQGLTGSLVRVLVSLYPPPGTLVLETLFLFLSSILLFLDNLCLSFFRLSFLFFLQINIFYLNMKWRF